MSLRSLNQLELATYLVGKAVCNTMAKGETHPNNKTIKDARPLIYVILGTNLAPDEFVAVHHAFAWLTRYEEDELRGPLQAFLDRMQRENPD